MGGKTIGVILIVVAVALVIVTTLFLLAGTFTQGNAVQPAAFMLCEGPTIILALVIAGIGIYMMMSGKKEELELIDVQKERLILDMIETRGKVRLTDIAVEAGLTQDQVAHYVYDLIGKKLFVGYVDWKGGILQSQQAKDMPEGKCPNCGGQLELAGKGVVKCPYCGTEIFLNQ